MAKYYDKMLQKDIIRWQFQGISCSRKLEYSKVGIALCKCHNCEMKQGTDLARRFLRNKPPVKRRFWGAGMKKPLLPWKSPTLRKYAQIHVMACTLIFHKKMRAKNEWFWPVGTGDARLQAKALANGAALEKSKSMGVWIRDQPSWTKSSRKIMRRSAWATLDLAVPVDRAVSAMNREVGEFKKPLPDKMKKKIRQMMTASAITLPIKI